MNIDTLLHKAVFSQSTEDRQDARKQIRQMAFEQGVIPSSIHPLYMAFGKNEITGFTVPAINIRTLTYDTARIIFRLMLTNHIGPVLFEIARSEIDYTEQRPDEYAVSILAAAIKENYKGPVFIQGDHFQLSKNRFNEDPEKEIGKIKALAKEAIDAAFYNIDIDASTLVDLKKPSLAEQQKNNFEVTSTLTRSIRSLQPPGTTISIGGEIGHIGGVNSTVADFEAFMTGYQSLVTHDGISKVSVQTGSSHGGIPLPDGSMASVQLDFSVLKSIGEIARSKYHIGGAVQHGASTLPSELFGTFPEVGTLEIHLATGFQNIVFDTIPDTLKNEMFAWLEQAKKDEWEKGWTREQFLYKTRKKSLGPFKQKLWELSEADKEPVHAALTKQLDYLFEKLRIHNTRNEMLRYF
jgi:fructose/tagatose bisphosphate aldolase